jgi:hypothetical protein
MMLLFLNFDKILGKDMETSLFEIKSYSGKMNLK